MKKEKFFEAVRLCNDEAAKVISFFGQVARVEEHIELMSDTRSYSLSRTYHKDLERGVTYESLEVTRDGLLKGLMYAMFDLNKAYKKAIGNKKANLIGHYEEANLETAVDIYEQLFEIAG